MKLSYACHNTRHDWGGGRLVLSAGKSEVLIGINWIAQLRAFRLMSTSPHAGMLVTPKLGEFTASACAV
jgi:hypothetical protein